MADAGTKIMHMHYDWDNERKILHASDMLCTALQIINHIQDCKDDFRNLDNL